MRGTIFQSGGPPPLQDHVKIEPVTGGYALCVVASAKKASKAEVYQEFLEALLRAGSRARREDIQAIYIVD